MKKNNIKNITNDTCINIRCTLKDKEILKKKANSKNISLSEYMLNSSLAGTEKRSVKEKRRIKKLIERTEFIKELQDIRDNSNNKNIKITKEMLQKIIDMEKGLWED